MKSRKREDFPTPVRDGVLANRQKATYTFLNEDLWYEVFGILLDRFERGDADWEELLFKLWTVRVLNYTTTSVLRGYSYAQRRLHSMVNRYIVRAGLGSGETGCSV